LSSGKKIYFNYLFIFFILFVNIKNRLTITQPAYKLIKKQGEVIMSDSTLTRMELSESIAQHVGIQKHEASSVLSTILEEMTRGLINDGQLKLSAFGSFSIRSKKERIGRNPKTGEEVMITPRKTLSFRASHILKKRIAKKKDKDAFLKAS